MRKRVLVAAIIGLCIATGIAKAQPKVSGQVTSGEAGYKVGCATQIASNPCSKVCWELWSAQQKEDIERRCAAQQKQSEGGGGSRGQATH